jgi:hypothetical protein
MSNGRNKNSKGDSGRDAGGFIALPWAVMDCAAYAMLSYTAKALLMEVARQFVRNNNGRLLLSFAYLSKRGWTSSDVITRAKRELIAAGFIYETVMGHRPNKASWYAITWQRLDRIPGFDAGVAETFRRGAYLDSTPLKPQKTREQLFKKWEGAGKKGSKAASSGKKTVTKNTTLTPAHGVESALIGPAHGVETLPVGPAHGAIDPIFGTRSTPAHGDHLEMPSTAANPVFSGKGLSIVREVVRVRDSALTVGVNAYLDEATGELVPITKPEKHQKQAADAWAASAIQEKGWAKCA